DLTLFEAQDAADIVSAASTSDVNIIFGTSINENLNDEVVVTVIATGIEEKDMPGGIGRSSQSNQRTQRSRPANVEDRDRRQASVDEEPASNRSEEHTSELQSRFDLVCRLLLEKKK